MIFKYQTSNHLPLKSILLAALVLSTVVLETSCHASKRTQGAIIGAVVGATTGALASKNNRAVAIILGAGIGGVAGGLIGEYMDKQAKEIQEDLKGAKVERVGEGIVVTFDSGLLFDFDSDALRSETKSNLDRLARTLNKYDKTEVIIFGHTDNTGESSYNLNLSKERASSVEKYLMTKSVAGRRLQLQGLGESDPVASNDNDYDRQLNRRVELTIIADKKLIRDAKKGRIPEA